MIDEPNWPASDEAAAAMVEGLVVAAKEEVVMEAALVAKAGAPLLPHGPPIFKCGVQQRQITPPRRCLDLINREKVKLYTYPSRCRNLDELAVKLDLWRGLRARLEGQGEVFTDRGLG